MDGAPEELPAEPAQQMTVAFDPELITVSKPCTQPGVSDVRTIEGEPEGISRGNGLCKGTVVVGRKCCGPGQPACAYIAM